MFNKRTRTGSSVLSLFATSIAEFESGNLVIKSNRRVHASTLPEYGAMEEVFCSVSTEPLTSVEADGSDGTSGVLLL